MFKCTVLQHIYVYTEPKSHRILLQRAVHLCAVTAEIIATAFQWRHFGRVKRAEIVHKVFVMAKYLIG